MPGSNLGAVRGTSLLIENLDCGPAQDLSIHDLSQKSWQQLEVNEAKFFRQQPVCGLSINEGGGKTIIFGGSGIN